MRERASLLQLYLSPLAIVPWLNRAVYLGVILAALVVGDRFWGTFNLMYAVSGALVGASVAGLGAHEVGLWFGWTRREDESRAATTPSVSNAAAPLVIFVAAVAGSVLLFALRGVPLLSDPLLRAELGLHLGPLKRLMYVLLPMSALELRLYSIRNARLSALSWSAVVTTLLIFFLLTFKSKLLFFAFMIYLLPYGLQRGGIRTPNVAKVVVRTTATLLVLAVLLALYGKFALDADQGGIAVVMLVRTTVLIAQAPNYIVGAMGRIPTTGELLGNEVAEVLRFLRLPGGELSRPIDTELTRDIMGDPNLVAGGLNPTVIGYGWMLAGIVGVIGMSFLYGWCTAAALRRFRSAASEQMAIFWLFAAFTVFDAVQIFSPVGVALDTGVSMLLYVAAHRVVVGFTSTSPGQGQAIAGAGRPFGLQE